MAHLSMRTPGAKTNRAVSPPIILMFSAAVGSGLAIGQLGTRIAVPLIALSVYIIACLIVREIVVVSTCLLWLLVFLPVPAVIPLGIAVPSGGQVFFSDFLVAVIAFCLILKLVSNDLKVSFSRGVGLTFLVSILLLAILNGLSNDAVVLQYFARDARPLVYLVVTIIAVTWMIENRREKVVKLFEFVIAFVILSTFIATLLIKFFDYSGFRGRFDTAALYVGGAQVAGPVDTRVLLPGAYLMMVVVPLIFACQYTFARRLLKPGLPLMFGAFATVSLFFSYQRTQAVAPVLTVLVLIFAFNHSISSSVRRIASALLVAAGICWTITQLFVGASGGVIEKSVASWSNRVIGGLNTSDVLTESSAQWRLVESGLAWNYIKSHWLLGSGFGVPYRANYPTEPFVGSDGLSYVHSSYIWPAVKFGLVLAVILLAILFSVVITSMIRARVRNSKDQTIVARLGVAVLLPLLIVAVAAPVPFSQGGSLVFGAGIALCIAASTSAKARAGVVRYGIVPRAAHQSERALPSKMFVDQH